MSCLRVKVVTNSRTPELNQDFSKYASHQQWKCPVYFSKHNVSETGFCPRLQVKPTQLGPIDRASPYLRR
jgi:hypothetical protein